MSDVIRFAIVSLAVIAVALAVLFGVPLAIFVWSTAPGETSCGLISQTSELAPDGKRAVSVKMKECDLGFGLDDAFIDIVIQPTAANAREEQILRIQIPKHPDDLQVHWAGDNLLVIHPPKEPLKQEIRSWFPSVKVRVT